MPRVTRGATRLQFGSLTEYDIDFPTLSISHSSECGNVSCPSVLTALPQEFEVPQPSSNVHSSFVVPNVGSSCVAHNPVHIVRSLFPQSRMQGHSNVGFTATSQPQGHVVHDLVDMPNENSHYVHDTPHEIQMTNVSTIPNHNNPHQMYVPTASPAMVRRRSNRLNQ